MVAWAYLIFVTGTTGGACGDISDKTRKYLLLNVEKIRHIEKFLHMRNVETNLSSGKFFTWERWRKSFMWRNFSAWIDLSPLQNRYPFWCLIAFYAVLLPNLSFVRLTLFCCKICFVTIYALWRGEKLCMWRKKDKYERCSSGSIYLRWKGEQAAGV